MPVDLSPVTLSRDFWTLSWAVWLTILTSRLSILCCRSSDEICVSDYALLSADAGTRYVYKRHNREIRGVIRSVAGEQKPCRSTGQSQLFTLIHQLAQWPRSSRASPRRT